MVDIEIEPKTYQKMGKRMLEIERQPIYSKEDQGEWNALTWALGIEDRTPPWGNNDA